VDVVEVWYLLDIESVGGGKTWRCERAGVPVGMGKAGV